MRPSLSWANTFSEGHDDMNDLQLFNAARRNGIKMPVRALRASKIEKAPYWVTCAFLMQESGGGENVFGHDPGNFSGAGKVTKAKYLDYKRRRQSGAGMQGVGPMQLTWYSFQDMADDLGGCWRPYINVRVGLQILKSYRGTGMSWKDSARRYNGSGPAADAYANQMEVRFAHWQRITGGK
jgi:hypothetical protein